MHTSSQIFRDQILSADDWRMRMKGLQNAFAFRAFIYAPSTCSLFSSSVALLDWKKPAETGIFSVRVLAPSKTDHLIEADFILFNSIIDIIDLQELVSEV